MFFKGSRYQRVKEYWVQDANGKKNGNKIKAIRKIPDTTKATTYVVKEGDRLDLLAYRFYRDPTKFWIICDANDSMFPPELVVPGNRITIPQEGL